MTRPVSCHPFYLVYNWSSVTSHWPPAIPLASSPSHSSSSPSSSSLLFVSSNSSSSGVSFSYSPVFPVDHHIPYSSSIPRTVEFPLSSNRHNPSATGHRVYHSHSTVKVRHYLRVRTAQLNKTSLSSYSITYVMFGSSQEP